MIETLSLVSSLGDLVFWIGIVIAVWRYKLLTGLLPKGVTNLMFWGMVASVVADLALMVVR